MKKYLIGLFLVAAFALYVVFANRNSGSPDNPPVALGNPEPTSTGRTPAPASSTSGSGTPSGGARKGSYKDGSYTGVTSDALYGPMQVKAVVSGGKITDIQFLEYPNDRGETMLVNNHALPILKQEALSSQSANVNVVSGATQSSQAFQESLASALAQAKS